MMEDMAASHADASLWDQAYAQGDSTRSWYQTQPTMSLRMLQLAGAQPNDSLIDIGGGAAPLTDALLEQGFTDLTVLDISQTGLGYAQQRLGPAAQGVTWVRADILSWRPERRYHIWHDRAVFHFLTTPIDRQRYLDVLADAVESSGRVVLGTFAADGPRHCSGLPVARYSPDTLAARLGRGITILATDREEHRTPAGTHQPFTWLLGQIAATQPTGQPATA
jgi:hypothetical protein